MPAYGPPDESPLLAADYTKLNNALASLNKARRKIDLAKSAGIDCSQREAECEYLEQRIAQAKSVYFPHKP